MIPTDPLTLPSALTVPPRAERAGVHTPAAPTARSRKPFDAQLAELEQHDLGAAARLINVLIERPFRTPIDVRRAVATAHAALVERAADT